MTPNFVVDSTIHRMEVTCTTCGDSMDTARNGFGETLVDAYKELHQCAKKAKR
ncbi:hypothetical protein SEA_VIBAKI_65 [Arthrobacter phage Vibaki]|uniref:Uncharacterized protein n=1 Tax=Arthrobacter phage Vibaki TaxID=2593333 RepID=A0A514TZ60_9CAUD|nr:hypothetical protein HYP95_gp65 [Arthrobacter phage Vibaki]QDK01945.1 hypothetical protein SEA_VIBAKI_65 [Arthrobacter phage Vibaki]